MIQRNSTTTYLNQAQFSTLIAQSIPQDSWQELPSPIAPVHAALLRTGKVLLYAGRETRSTNVNNPYRGTTVWDVSTNTFFSPAAPVDAVGLPIDLFCSGMSFLPDGRLMVVGGTGQYDPFRGLPAVVFDPITEQWTPVQPMNSGR